MRETIVLLTLGLLLAASGCGKSPIADRAQDPAPAVAPTAGTEAQPPTRSVDDASKRSTAEANKAQPPAEANEPQAEVTVIEPEVAAAQTTEPTTARAALAVVNLETFPRFKVKQAYESQPLSIYYSSESNVASADQFLMSELAKAGWKEAKHLVTSTDQYVDKLLSKEGYYLRLTVSSGSSREEVAINMTVLGNFDVRTLPKTKDAEPQESTPVMAGHLSKLSIPDAYDELSKQMLDAGWQIVQDFHPAADEVPHYRSIRFRKQAMRVNLGLAKNPTLPAEMTNIFYHAEAVMPFDVPMFDSRQPMRYDVVENRALIPWHGDRTKLVKLLNKNAEHFGWTLINADDYVNEKISTLYISDGSPVGIATRYVESAGKYSVTMDRVLLPTKKESNATPAADKAVAQSTDPASDAAAKKMKTEIVAQFEQAENAAEKAINAELAKALGSLNGPANKVDLQALQAQAAKLQSQLGALSDEPAAAAKTNTKPINVLDVPDDEAPLSPADMDIKATEARVKLGNRDIVLKHCLAYARMEDGQATKIILLSSQPLQTAKLDKLCASGESFTIYDGFGDRPLDVVLELRIAKDSVNMNFAADGMSLSTNSSHLKSSVRLKNGKLQGRVTLAEPLSLQKQPLTLEVAVAEKTRRPASQ